MPLPTSPSAQTRPVRQPRGPTPGGATGAAVATGVLATPHVTTNPFPKPRPFCLPSFTLRRGSMEFSEVCK